MWSIACNFYQAFKVHTGNQFVDTPGICLYRLCDDKNENKKKKHVRITVQLNTKIFTRFWRQRQR